MTTIKLLISAPEQCSNTACNKLTESLDLDEYESLLYNLKVKISELEAAASGGGANLQNSESREVQAALIITRSWQVNSLETNHFIVVSKQVTPVVKKRTAKLPELKLVIFKWDYDEWDIFWSTFRYNVDSRDDLEPSAKLSYLLQSVDWERKEIIRGLPNTDQNYDVAVNLLTERFGDATKQTHVLLQKFHNLLSPKHNSKDLCSFLIEYRKVREQMRNITKNR